MCTKEIFYVFLYDIIFKKYIFSKGYIKPPQEKINLPVFAYTINVYQYLNAL